jgi:hypothetical protein
LYGNLGLISGQIVTLAGWPSSSVYPSGGDFATRSAPIVPVATELFSTTTGWPLRSCNR